MIHLNKKLILIGLIVIGLIVGVVGAQLYQEWTSSQSAVVSEIGLTFLLDDVAWDGATAINWGLVVPDTTYTCDLTIENTGTVTIEIGNYTTSIPADWTQTLNLDTYTLDPTDTATGTIDLYVPPTASGTPSWTYTINATEVTP